MRNKFLLSICICGLLLSCKSEVADVVEEETEVIVQDEIVSNIGVQPTKKAAKELEAWAEYQMAKSIIEGYTSITRGLALENAKNLSGLIKGLQESQLPEILDRPDVVIRINVLYNHALRLNDMLTITSITDEEVETEITRLLQAYSSLIDKINTVFKIDEYEKKYNVKTEKETKTIKSTKRNDIRLKAMRDYEKSSKN